jgi:hypothetical protein
MVDVHESVTEGGGSAMEVPPMAPGVVYRRAKRLMSATATKSSNARIVDEIGCE